MRIVFIGCVEFSGEAMRTLLNVSGVRIVGVVTRRLSDFNSDFFDLSDLAGANNIPFFYADQERDKKLSDWVRQRECDYIYCFGWSYLLPVSLLSAARYGAIGFHPAALPANRGRHPLIWALALGLSQTASSFFYMDEGADTGDILSQLEVQIYPEDTAKTLQARISAVAMDQIQSFTAMLIDGKAPRTPQPTGVGNVWRKRSHLDGQIDWRMSVSAIKNLVRALSRPYVGAHCKYKGLDVKIWNVREAHWPNNNIEPGKVLVAGGVDEIVIKCYDGAISITEHEFDEIPTQGTYL